MLLSEMHFSEEASVKLGRMKGRTKLTPNILARIGFCLSLENRTLPDLADYEGTGHISIKWHVLTGAYEALFVALIKERCYQDGVCEAEITNQFKAHMNRGVLLLDKRLKNLDGLMLTLPTIWRQEADG